MADQSVISPLNRAGLTCGDSFSEQKLCFDLNGITIKKGSETKAVFPLDFCMSSSEYSLEERILPANGNSLNPIIVKDEPALTFFALRVKYPKKVEENWLMYGFESDKILGNYKSFNSILIFSFGPYPVPQEKIYVYNPQDFDVTVTLLKSI